MFGLGMGEILVVLILALLVLGPQRLPEVARKLARLLGQVRSVADDVRRDFDEAARAPKDISREIHSSINKLPAAKSRHEN